MKMQELAKKHFMTKSRPSISHSRQQTLAGQIPKQQEFFNESPVDDYFRRTSVSIMKPSHTLCNGSYKRKQQ
jgi:hypothetical protein